VEHVNPKSVSPALETEWTNFLLGCANCNSVKGATPTNSEDFLWPDRDNTVRAFTYREGGFIEVSTGLDPAVQDRALALLELTGLHRHPQSPLGADPARRDKRWKDREQVWRLAMIEKERLGKFPENVRELAREFILEAALGYGFFSVWLTVFADDERIRLALIAGFVGTDRASFDQHGFAQPRPLGRL
jgi:hypothetical protein